MRYPPRCAVRHGAWRARSLSLFARSRVLQRPEVGYQGRMRLAAALYVVLLIVPGL
jgi:hypothetical protein